jgi:solute carrier family 25 (mitochondrial S-adenosylmethionine transporter), member 26
MYSAGFLKAGGFNGVYRGLSAAAVGSAPGAAVFFSSYETLKVDAASSCV